jgi:excisionase family DNA binding protein
VSAGLLTIAAAAAELGVSPRTLRRRIAAGELPVFRDGGIVRVSRADLIRYVASKTRRSARPDGQERFPGAGRGPGSPGPLAPVERLW